MSAPMLDFVKMHGTGNDFPVFGDLDDRLHFSAEAVRRLTDRHFGIGGDGIIRLAPGSKAPYFMDYRNSDGSLAQSCGNGLRVCGKWLGDRGHVGDSVSIETRGGVNHLALHRNALGLVESVSVDMGAPIGKIRSDVLEVDGLSYEATLVDIPNPHAVLMVDDVDASPVAALGSRIERHTHFPNGTNVEFVELRDGSLRQRTWERGSGETLACGTGACAVAVAAISGGLVTSPVDIDLRGGRLRLEWTSGGSVTMTGPADAVYEGSVDTQYFGIEVSN